MPDDDKPQAITLTIGDTVHLSVEILKRENWQVGEHLTLKLIDLVPQEDGSTAMVLGHDGDS